MPLRTQVAARFWSSGDSCFQNCCAFERARVARRHERELQRVRVGLARQRGLVLRQRMRVIAARHQARGSLEQRVLIARLRTRAGVRGRDHHDRCIGDHRRFDRDRQRWHDGDLVLAAARGRDPEHDPESTPNPP